MIGNDLVYLPDWPQRTGSRLQRFRTKVYTEAEREFITLNEDPHLAEAWLWSCKEAAYKVWFKTSHRREFAPKRFVVDSSKFNVECADACNAESPCRLKRLHLMSGLKADLLAFDRKYFLYSTMEDDCIHTLASDQSFAELRKIEFWRGHFRPESLNYNGYPLRIEKDARKIPFGRWQGQRLDLSISHDGPAFCIAIK